MVKQVFVNPNRPQQARPKNEGKSMCYHETVNRQFKVLGVPGPHFRGQPTTHEMHFMAAANLTQFLGFNKRPGLGFNKRVGREPEDEDEWELFAVQYDD